MKEKELKEIKEILGKYGLCLMTWKPDKQKLYKVYSGNLNSQIVDSEVMTTSELKIWIDGFLAGTRIKEVRK